MVEKSDVRTVYKDHSTGNIYRDIHGWQKKLHEHKFGDSFIGRRLKTWKPWWCALHMPQRVALPRLRLFGAERSIDQDSRSASPQLTC